MRQFRQDQTDKSYCGEMRKTKQKGTGINVVIFILLRTRVTVARNTVGISPPWA